MQQKCFGYKKKNLYGSFYKIITELKNKAPSLEGEALKSNFQN